MKMTSLAGLISLMLTLGCDQDKPKPSVAPDPTPVVAAVTAKSALNQTMVATQLNRLSKSLGCVGETDAVDRLWCEGIEGWAGATHSVAQLPDKDAVFVGLTQWIGATENIDVGTQAPAVLGIKASSGQHMANVVRVKSRNKANANKVRGMRFQVRRNLSGDARPVVLTDPKFYTYITQAHTRATFSLEAHTKGWQLSGGNHVDLRKVGDLWIGIHESNLKKGEAAGVHVYMLKEVPVSNVLPAAKDVDVSALRARLACEKPSGNVVGCGVLKGFEGGQRVVDAGLWAGPITSAHQAGESAMFAIKLSGKPSALSATSGYLPQAEGLKGKSDKSLGAQLVQVDADFKKAPSTRLEPAGAVTLLHTQRGDFAAKKNFKTYTYLRQSGDVLYAIVSDPLGGGRWFATLKKM